MIGITRSIMTKSPLFEHMKQMNAVISVTEYKTAASTSTYIIGIIVSFVLVRIVAILCSIAHIRYAINPELNTLATTVEIKNAMIHLENSWVKMLRRYTTA